MRIAKNASIENPDVIRNLLTISSTNVAIIANRIRNQIRNLTENWKIESVASHDTYFENKNGFKESEIGFVQPTLGITPIRIQPYTSPMYTFLLRNVNSPYIQPVRGFKTKTNREQSSLFNRKQSLGKIGEEPGFAGLAVKDSGDKNADIEQLNKILHTSGLSEEEKNQVRKSS